MTTCALKNKLGTPNGFLWTTFVQATSFRSHVCFVVGRCLKGGQVAHNHGSNPLPTTPSRLKLAVYTAS